MFSYLLILNSTQFNFNSPRLISSLPTSAQVEEQRKYLGGDSEHTVLVKGLDFALLEQTRARVAAEAAATEDVSLEEAYMESVAQPKKRTREEILRELKSKRGSAPAAQSVGAPGAAAAASYRRSSA